MARRRIIDQAGWPIGLVDGEYHNVPADERKRTFREAINWWHTSGDCMETRAPLRLDRGPDTIVGNIVDFIEFSQSAVGSGFVLSPVYFVVTSEKIGLALTMRIYRWTSTSITLAHTLVNPIAPTNPDTSVRHIRRDDDLIITGFWLPAVRVTSAGFATPIQFYDRFAGTFQTVTKIQVTGTRSGTFVVDDIISNTTDDWSARLVAVVQGSDAASQTHTFWLANFTEDNLPVNGAVIALVSGSSDGVLSGTVAATPSVALRSTDALLRDLYPGVSPSISFRYAGVDYTSTVLPTGDILVPVGWPHPEIEFATFDRPRPVSIHPIYDVTWYQGRYVYLGLGRRVFFSAVNTDDVVGVAGVETTIDPSGPIDITIQSGSDAQFRWIESGDTIFIGGSEHEYAMNNPNGIAPLSNLLPNFKIIGDHGSNATTPVSVFDGRVSFVPQSGGEVISLEFSFSNARHNAIDIAKLIRNKLSDPRAIVFRKSIDDDPVQRVFVQGGVDKLWVGSYNDPGKSVPAWSGYVTVPAGYEIVDIVYARASVRILARDSSGDYSVLSFDHTQDDYVIDLAHVTTSISPTGVMTVDPIFTDSLIIAVGTADGLQRNIGFFEASGTTVQLDQDYDTVTYGFAVENTWRLAKAESEDERGAALNRKKRLVAVSIGYQDSRQVEVNGQTLVRGLNTVLEADLPKRTDVRKINLSGWSYDPPIDIRSIQPYKLTITSIAVEVAI